MNRTAFLKFLVLCCLATSAVPLRGQEMLGIMNSSYSGITGAVLNPAVTVTSPYYFDFNIVAGDVFFENNYLYLAKEEYRFSRFFSKNPDFPTHGTDNSMIAYDYYNEKDKNAYANQRFLGPSFALTVGRSSFGIVTGTRMVMSTRNVPYDIAKFIYEKLEYPPQYDIQYQHTRNIYNAQMAWAEYGFNYSYVLKQLNSDYWAAGISVKALKSYAGGYVFGDNEDYMVNDSLIVVNSFTGEVGYSLPLDYETNEYIRDPLFRGKGMGVDIGMIYEKKKKGSLTDQRSKKLCSPTYTPYDYKIGISILDIGRVRFTENAEKLVFGGVPVNWQPTTGYSVYSVRDVTDTLSQMFYGNKTDLIQGHEITIGLPTALSVQADVNYYKNWYINSTLIVPLQFSKSGLRRPALLGIAPRYQTARFEASMPVTLYDWSKPRIGLSARFLGFFAGTEKISGFFHFKDFTGLDFYAGVKLSLSKGHCHSKGTENCGIEEYKLFNKH